LARELKPRLSRYYWAQCLNSEEKITVESVPQWLKPDTISGFLRRGWKPRPFKAVPSLQRRFRRLDCGGFIFYLYRQSCLVVAPWGKFRLLQI
jgi:hypothetical protein